MIRWRKVQEGARLSQRVTWTGGLWVAREAVSREVTGALQGLSPCSWFSVQFLGVFVPIRLKKGHLKNVLLAGLGCRDCLLFMLDKTACKHRVSRKKSLGLSLLPATLAACPDSPPSAQAILVAPLPPKTASSINVHCRVGKGQVTACPQRSCMLRSIPSGLLTLAQAFLATIQKSRQVTGFGQSSVVL